MTTRMDGRIAYKLTNRGVRADARPVAPRIIYLTPAEAQKLHGKSSRAGFRLSRVKDE